MWSSNREKRDSKKVFGFRSRSRRKDGQRVLLLFRWTISVTRPDEESGGRRDNEKPAATLIPSRVLSPMACYLAVLPPTTDRLESRRPPRSSVIINLNRNSPAHKDYLYDLLPCARVNAPLFSCCSLWLAVVTAILYLLSKFGSHRKEI